MSLASTPELALFKCLYGTDQKYVDVTNIIKDRFVRNNKLHLDDGYKFFNQLFGDPHEGVAKCLKVCVLDNKQYIIGESDTLEYNINIQTGELVKPDDQHMAQLATFVKCLYGSESKSVDVSLKVLNRYFDDNKLKFSKGPKMFNIILSDPDPCQYKSLRIFIKGKMYTINETDETEFIIDIYPPEANHDTNYLITFIVPTIGRISLLQTLESIESQTIDKWKAIIVFDNVEPSQEIKTKLDSNKLFSYIVLPHKLGQRRNNAGMVRNIGIHMATTEWVGFVDDDDSLMPNYVERVTKEISECPAVDCIIFRMLYQTYVIPHYLINILKKENVGISFCYKTAMRAKFNFEAGDHEDYELLDAFKMAGKKMILSNYVTYRVQNTMVPFYIGHWETLIKRGVISVAQDD